MSDAPPFDVAALLAPCDGDDPCGPALGTYHDGKDALKTEAKRLRDEDPGDPGWNAVREDAVAILSESKDLQVLATLAEASLETHGAAGLTAVLAVAAGWCEDYWDGLHPRPEADDPDDEPEIALRNRSSLLASMISGTRPYLPGKLQQRPLPEPPDTLRGPDRVAFYRDANAGLDACRDALTRLEAAADAGFDASVDAFDERLPRDVRAADLMVSGQDLVAALDARADALRAAFAEAFPGESLETPEDLPDVPAEATGDDESADAPVLAAMAAPQPGGPPQTRPQAVHALRQVVQYFDGKEPDSPVGLLVKRAIKWTEMTLPEVLKELIEEEDTIDKVQKTLGVAPPPADDEYE